MNQIKSNTYRWLVLAGILLLLLNFWTEFPVVYLIADPLARFLFLVFAAFYWKDHKDAFSALLLLATLGIFILGVASALSFYVSPSLL
jgi:hypothetical protein